MIEESNINLSFSAKEIFLKTNKELMDTYIDSLIQTMGGENLIGMKIILDTCYGSATTCAKKFSESWS